MRAVQLIAFDANKNPYMPPSAVALLRSLPSASLHVIAVAGKYRTGKSYILNRVLLDRSEGFSVGHTINACTKGLWVWPELVRLEGKDCLIIDTEGLGSLEQGESTDLKIFLLALLFSSQLIYNSVGSIDEQAIQSLSLVIQLATVLQRQDRYDSQELVNTFPAFLWLIRDFSLKLQNEKGVKISPGEYLELALRHQARSSQAADRKNQIRKQLRTFFQERDCYALVRPTEEERDLQNLSTVEDAKLRPEFVALVEGLRRKLAGSVRAKRVRGRTLNTQGFIQLCQYYTKALVDGKLPTISSHWDNLCLAETHRIFQKFQLDHIEALKTLEDDPGKMLVAHKAIVQQGVDAIEKSFLGKLQKQLFRERFERKLEGQLQQARGRASSRKTREVRLMLESMDQGQSGHPLERLESVIMRMAQISESSSRDEGHYCELYLYLCEFSRSLLEEATNSRAEQQQILDARVIALQQQLGFLREQMESERTAHEQQLLAVRKKMGESHIREDCEREQRSLAQLFQLQSTSKALVQQVSVLQETLLARQSQLATLRSSERQLSATVAALQSQVFSLQKEVLQREAAVNLQTIKSRKVTRQKQIIKQRYEENLEQGLTMRSTIDGLERRVAELQAKEYSGTGEGSARVQAEILLGREENRLMARLMKEQQVSYEAVMQLPQNISYQAMKKNLEVERSQRERLALQLQEVQSYVKEKMEFVSRSLYFDVSYYTCEKELIFTVNISNGSDAWQLSRRWSHIKEIVDKIKQIKVEQSEYEILRSTIEGWLNDGMLN